MFVNFLTLNISFLPSRVVQQNQQPLLKLQPEISQDYYRHVFNTEFNLGFGLLRMDTCTRCDELASAIKVSSGEEKNSSKRSRPNTKRRHKPATTVNAVKR